MSSGSRASATPFCRIQTRGNRDQLNVIFNVLGTPSEEDIEALEKDDARKYIRIFSKRNGRDLAERFSASSREAAAALVLVVVECL